MIARSGVLFLILSAVSSVAVAAEKGNSLLIPQVSGVPVAPDKEAATEKKLFREDSMLTGQKPDYQDQIINNPRYSDYGKAQAAMEATAVPEGGASISSIKQDADKKDISEEQMGHNIAVIRQEGQNNASSVTQTGKNNVAIQKQKGIKNDLSVTQTGDKNQSYEEQIGNFNHKKKVQNGVVVEEKDERN